MTRNSLAMELMIARDRDQAAHRRIEPFQTDRTGRQLVRSSQGDIFSFFLLDRSGCDSLAPLSRRRLGDRCGSRKSREGRGVCGRKGGEGGSSDGRCRGDASVGRMLRRYRQVLSSLGRGCERCRRRAGRRGSRFGVREVGEDGEDLDDMAFLGTASAKQSALSNSYEECVIG
jgi:hypothetical protein